MRDSPWTEEQLYARLEEWLVKPRRWWRGRKPQAPPTHEADLAQVEAELGLRLPPEYRRFLLKYAHLEFVSLAPYTAPQLPRAAAEARAKGVPGHLLPFCHDIGNYFCFDTRHE